MSVRHFHFVKLSSMRTVADYIVLLTEIIVNPGVAFRKIILMSLFSSISHPDFFTPKPFPLSTVTPLTCCPSTHSFSMFTEKGEGVGPVRAAATGWPCKATNIEHWRSLAIRLLQVVGWLWDSVLCDVGQLHDSLHA